MAKCLSYFQLWKHVLTCYFRLLCLTSSIGPLEKQSCLLETRFINQWVDTKLIPLFFIHTKTQHPRIWVCLLKVNPWPKLNSKNKFQKDLFINLLLIRRNKCPSKSGTLSFSCSSVVEGSWSGNNSQELLSLALCTGMKHMQCRNTGCNAAY